MKLKNLEKDFPKIRTLKDGTELSIRLMKREDKNQVIAFYKKIPDQDKEYFRVNFWEADSMEDLWLKQIESGKTVTLLGVIKKEVVGIVSLHQNLARGAEHLAYLGLSVSEKYRGKGIAHTLCSEIYAIAVAAKLEKVYAEVVTNQDRSISLFTNRLGFRMEAILKDHVKSGEKNLDLLILSNSPATLAEELKKRYRHHDFVQSFEQPE